MIALIVGSTGAGKTTYSKKFGESWPGVVYSIDNWMKNLYGQDMPKDPPSNWYYENQKWYVGRIERCQNQIRELALEGALKGYNAILDLGFTTKDHRKSFIDFFSKHGISTEIHYLNISIEERKRRVQERNSTKGETFVMTVDDTLFDYMESIFEPPTEDEGAGIRTIE